MARSIDAATRCPIYQTVSEAGHTPLHAPPDSGRLQEALDLRAMTSGYPRRPPPATRSPTKLSRYRRWSSSRRLCTPALLKMCFR